MSADRRTMNILLAVLDIEQRQLTELMGSRDGWPMSWTNGLVSNS